MKFCVIIPMFNEQGNVLNCVSAVNQVLKKYHYKADIIIVNDGSKDNTAKEIEKTKKSYKNITVKVHRKNRGFGASVKTGMQAAIKGNYEFAVFMDADLTMSPEYIKDFYNKINEGYDFVTGSRFVKGGGMKNVPFFRKAISVIGRFVLSICFRLPIHDYSQGFRAIKVWLFKKMKLKEKGFHVLIEELLWARKYTKRFSEIPFVLTTRKVGISKFRYTPKVYFKYFYYCIKALLT